MFSYDLSDELRELLPKLQNKDPMRAVIVYKKIRQIVASDERTIDHYKNLRNDMSEYKRVHVDASFVLIFKVDKKNKFILFDRLDHHDKIYK